MGRVSLLKDLINEKGLKLEYVAGKLGITRESMSAKINGRRDFRLSEVQMLKQILNLSANDILTIFFKK